MKKKKKVFNKKKYDVLSVVTVALSDFIAITGAALLAVFAIFWHVDFTSELLWWYLANLSVSYVFLILFRLYYFLFDTIGLVDTLKLLGASAFIFGVGCSYSPFLMGGWLSGISVQLVYVGAFFLLILAIRYSKRIYMMIKYSFTKSGRGKVRAMIVGGGNAGAALIREMQTTDKIAYNPVCVIDDDELKVGKTINDVKIVGTTADIKMYAEKYAVDEILIAIPSAKKSDTKRIYEMCKTTNCKVKILPGLYQIVNGEANFASLREVRITDLLGREQIQVNLDEIMGYIEGQTVLVTGGGGSIGSELCRQIATHNPKLLIILDIYENNAYDIEQELHRRHPSLNLIALIASIRDKGKMEDVFEKYRPDIVFNAAAHKHVPLMEASPNEAVKNNVFGTLNVARCADKYGVKTFVQISTDKAVNPTNIMGATKRICEMIIQTIGRNSKNTNFVAVRFGNVLGSNGSVIPLFEKQIAEGGPVTVTHKDIIRYFMTIPEAVSLVLQAGAYAKGGQIFVLDMGEPVRIYELAYNLIKLSGLVPNVDIEIKCTGLRPGEKLYEERLMDEEGLQTTPNGLISIANPIALDEEVLWSKLDELYKAAYEETDDMKLLVSQLVTTYTPQ